jgi:hypothetical protein
MQRWIPNLLFLAACSEEDVADMPATPEPPPVTKPPAMEPPMMEPPVTDPCHRHCGNGSMDCGETGFDCGGSCAACAPPVDDARVESDTLPDEVVCEASISASITVRNAGDIVWHPSTHALAYAGGLDGSSIALDRDVSPGELVTFAATLTAPTAPGVYEARYQMTAGSSALGGALSKAIVVTDGCTPPACDFPFGVPDEGFIASAASSSDTDPTVDAEVNAVMVELTGCGVGSSCPITGLPGADAGEVCQSWFTVVNEALRARGLCAGQHELGSTDEIAVSNTGCDGRWYGYHVCYYGGPAVVWNPGARRGWWQIASEWCAP